MIKKVTAAVLAFVLIFSLSTVAFGVDTDALQSSITKNYEKALELAGGRSSFHGSCNLATAYQLQVLGIFKDGLDYSGSGNKWYDYYKDETKTSGGYSVVTISGKNCLYELVEKYGNEIYNVVFSLGSGGSSGNNHVMLIRAIIDNNVYFNDSFACTYGGKYYSEGDCIVTSLDKFISFYKSMNGDAHGCIYFTNGKPGHFEGSDNNVSDKIYEKGDYLTTASYLRIRPNPSTEGEHLGSIPYGTTVTVTEISENWGKTVYDGVSGWICLDYATKIGASVSGKIEVTSLTADKNFAGVGDTVTWTAKAEGGAEGDYSFAFTLLLNGEEIYTTDFENSDTVTYTLTSAGIYTMCVEVADEEGDTAELTGDELECIETDGLIRGDFNCDGKVSAADARSILRISARLDTASGKELYTADTNGDGKINSSDARLALRISAKLEKI